MPGARSVAAERGGLCHELLTSSTGEVYPQPAHRLKRRRGVCTRSSRTAASCRFAGTCAGASGCAMRRRGSAFPAPSLPTGAPREASGGGTASVRERWSARSAAADPRRDGETGSGRRYPAARVVAGGPSTRSGPSRRPSSSRQPSGTCSRGPSASMCRAGGCRRGTEWRCRAHARPRPRPSPGRRQRRRRRLLRPQPSRPCPCPWMCRNHSTQLSSGPGQRGL